MPEAKIQPCAFRHRRCSCLHDSNECDAENDSVSRNSCGVYGRLKEDGVDFHSGFHIYQTNILITHDREEACLLMERWELLDNTDNSHLPDKQASSPCLLVYSMENSPIIQTSKLLRQVCISTECIFFIIQKYSINIFLMEIWEFILHNFILKKKY